MKTRTVILAGALLAAAWLFAAAVPAKPFIRPAYERIVTLSGSFLRSEVSAGIAREAAKYAAKGKSIRMGGGA